MPKQLKDTRDSGCCQPVPVIAAGDIDQMADTPYPSDDGTDLPRTVRQQQKEQKEARARDQMAREILNAPRPAYAQQAQASQRAAQSAVTPPSASNGQSGDQSALSADALRSQEYAQSSRLPPGQTPPVTVTRFQVPFLHMVVYFLKAALAAIPAMLLLGAIFWVLGTLAQSYIPALVKMRILITFPG